MIALAAIEVSEGTYIVIQSVIASVIGLTIGWYGFLFLRARQLKKSGGMLTLSGKGTFAISVKRVPGGDDDLYVCPGCNGRPNPKRSCQCREFGDGEGQITEMDLRKAFGYMMANIVELEIEEDE